MKNIRLSNVSYLLQAADLYDAKDLKYTCVYYSLIFYYYSLLFSLFLFFIITLIIFILIISETVMHFIADHYHQMVDLNEVTQIKCFSDWVVNFLKKSLQIKKSILESPVSRRSVILNDNNNKDLFNTTSQNSF